MSKIREYLTVVGEDPLDSEILEYLFYHSLRSTRDDIALHITSCPRSTLDYHLKKLYDKGRIERETVSTGGAPRRPAYQYSLAPKLWRAMRDVQGYDTHIRAIRKARSLGHPAPSDEEIINWFLAREERGIFIPHVEEDEG